MNAFIQYIKYYLSTIILLIAMSTCFMNPDAPFYFLLIFSITVILGDFLLPEDGSSYNYKYPFLINIPIYLNLLLLIIFVSFVIISLGNRSSNWVIDIYSFYLNLNLLSIQNSINLVNKISLIAITGLLIGIMGTVPGHELTHRKKNKFDMFFGNWLLALSWDCAFAIEHVYGHHKNVGLTSDPATAKRRENIYTFIIRAIVNEQRDAWKIDIEHLKRRGVFPFGLQNRMLSGYMRSLFLTIGAYYLGGMVGMLYFLLCAFVAKSLLEVINYTEHYGLVREPGQPVFPRHSWNSNKAISSLLLYNVTRHSAHHEKAHLKFWELDPYTNAPMMPYGYLSMLYLAIFCPYFYHKIMIKELKNWDGNHATPGELKIIDKLC